MNSDRRGFLKTLGLMVPGACVAGTLPGFACVPSRTDMIDGISVYLVNVMKERNFSHGTWHNRQHLFIAVQAGGHTGWTEIVVAKNQLDFDVGKWAEILIPLQGKSIQEAISLSRENYFNESWGRGDCEGIQIALYDLLGRRMNRPVIEFWGLPGREAVPGIFTILEKEIPKALEQAEIAKQQKLTSHVKVKLFGIRDHDLQLMKALRQQLGEDTFILGDPNRGYKYITDIDRLARVLTDLHKAGMDAVEDPSELTKAQWIELKTKVGGLALAPDEIMRPADEGLEVFSPEMGTYFNLHPNQMGNLEEMNKLASKITGSDCRLMIGDASLVGPACTFWQQIAIGHGASWVEALEKPQESDIFQKCIEEKSTALIDGKVTLTDLKPGFGLKLNQTKLAELADMHIRLF